MSGSPAPWVAIGAVLVSSSQLSSHGARPPQGFAGSSRPWFALPFTKLAEFPDLSQALGASALLRPAALGPEAHGASALPGTVALAPWPGESLWNTTAIRSGRRTKRKGGGSLAEVDGNMLHDALPTEALPDPGWAFPSSVSMLTLDGKVIEMVGNGTAIMEAWMDILFDLLAGEDGNITAHTWNITFAERASKDMFAKMDPGSTGKVNRTAFKSGWGAGVDAMEMAPQSGGPPPPMRVAMEMAIFEELLFHALVEGRNQTVSWARVQNTTAKGHFGADEASFEKEFGPHGMSPDGMHQYLWKIGALIFPKKQEPPKAQPSSAASPSAAAAAAAAALLAALLAGERGGGECGGGG